MLCLVRTKCVGRVLVGASECLQIQAMLLDIYRWHTSKEILRNKSMFNDCFVVPFFANKYIELRVDQLVQLFLFN